jgi:hypothetical protein
MRSRLGSEGGLTLLEVLGAIAVLMFGIFVAVMWTNGRAAAQAQERSACVSQMDRIRTDINAWAKTTGPQNPGGDRAECVRIKGMVEQYNSQCSEVIGALPVPTDCDH